MEEVFSECDTITVMRDGHTIITKPTAEISVDEVVRHMVGRSIDEFYPARTTTPGEVVMSVDNLKPEGFDNENLLLLAQRRNPRRRRPYGRGPYRNNARYLWCR